MMILSSLSLFCVWLILLVVVTNSFLVAPITSSRSPSSIIYKGIGLTGQFGSQQLRKGGNRIRWGGHGGRGGASNNNNSIRNNRKPWFLSHHNHRDRMATTTDSGADAANANAAASSTSIADDSSPPKYVPNIFPKEKEEILFLQEILETNFLFQDFSSSYEENEITNDKKKEKSIDKNTNLSNIIQSFEKCTYKEGTMLTQQGDTIDDDDTNIDSTNAYLYLIVNGTSSVIIDSKQLPEPYGTMGEGSLFGDLAMLYGTARAATIRCETPTVTVYRLHRSDFYHFLDFDKDDATSSSTSTTTSIRHEEIQQQVKEIDDVIDQISGVKSKYDGDIIKQFQPQRKYLLRIWKGTILQYAWKAAIINMAISLLFMTIVYSTNHHLFDYPHTWPVGGIPDKFHPLVIRTQGLYKLWGYTMSITTLVLTFFLSDAYATWRNIYTSGRKIQGRLNDISLMLACSVERNPTTGLYTDRGLTLINDVATSCRLCHAFSWAGFVKKFNILLTHRGLSRMLSRGVMNRSQYDTLVGIHPTNVCPPQHVTLMWIMAQIFQGMREGIIPNDDATRTIFISKICDLRCALAGVGDSLSGRIPVIYPHFVQLIVDIFLALSPFALYAELGCWSVPAVGILTIFYSGMVDLAKNLLDPLDNCNFYKNSSNNLDTGVLLKESNAGSIRWKTGLEKLPFKYSS